jgi:DNA replication protein DnaC
MPVDYKHALKWLENKGQNLYGKHFQILETDHEIIFKLICYFLKDQNQAQNYNLDLNKGILLTGPIGCGKTSLMTLMGYFQKHEDRIIIKPCRDINFEFIKEGYQTIHKYSKDSFYKDKPKVYCFDDLGVENNLKHYGNECNTMAEILLSRYDLFISKKLITHLTTNLSASEIEAMYGNRVRSRMRELFNLIAFESNTRDKRK